MTITRHPREAALLPCPFCGEFAEHGEVDQPGDSQHGGHFIQCTNAICGASTNLRFACGEDPRPELVGQWNRRALPTADGNPREAALERALKAYAAIVGLDSKARMIGVFSTPEAVKELREALAALDALPAADGGWRPISEAPKDGTELLGWCDGAKDPYNRGDRYAVIRWDLVDPQSDNLTKDWLDTPTWWHRPTHYHPLPPPPVPQSAEDEG